MAIIKRQMNCLMQQLLDSEVDMEYDYYYRMVGINTSLSFFESQLAEQEPQEEPKIEKDMENHENLLMVNYLDCQSEESKTPKSSCSDSEPFEPSSEMLEESMVSQPSKTASEKKPRKGAQKKAKGYPTKNFLPNFKGPHLEFLESQLGADYVNSFDLVKTIKAKNGISLLDYENLYKVEQFQDAFKAFFKRKILYRELMLSRSGHEAKLIHSAKLYVFERAFNRKSFKKIN